MQVADFVGIVVVVVVNDDAGGGNDVWGRSCRGNRNVSWDRDTMLARSCGTFRLQRQSNSERRQRKVTCTRVYGSSSHRRYDSTRGRHGTSELDVSVYGMKAFLYGRHGGCPGRRTVSRPVAARDTI
jgi:hypothetical protein